MFNAWFVVYMFVNLHLQRHQPLILLLCIIYDAPLVSHSNSPALTGWLQRQGCNSEVQNLFSKP